MLTEHQKEFIKLLREIAPSKRDHDIFRDFVMLASSSIHNGTMFSQEIEDRYMDIAKNYTKKQLITFSHMLACVVEGLEKQHHDFLGVVFMELDMGNAHIGQFFTPYSVSRMMAEITVNSDNWVEILQRKSTITASEPACGTGGMLIAISEVLKNKGCIYSDSLWVSAVDVDETVAMACYIQISLLGIAGEVIVGNTLSLELRYSLKTPIHYLKAFDAKLSSDRIVDKKPVTPPSSKIEVEEVEEKKTDVIFQETEQIKFDF